VTTDRIPKPTPDEWQQVINMLLEVQRTLADSIESGCVEEHDHHIVGLPSGVQDSTPGGARIEAALYAVKGARHLIRQAVEGKELPGVPVLQRAQKDFGMAGGYVAATWATELSERDNGRHK
jgi:hypothetical protein